MLIHLFSLLILAISPFQLPQMNAVSPEALYSSSDFPDSVFVIENYFSSCSACNANASNVNALAAEVEHRHHIQVLDVGIDRYDSEYSDWIARHDPNHPVLKDDRRKLTGQLGTRVYPTTYIVDKQGNVVFKSEGVWSQKTKRLIRAKLHELSP